MEEETYLLNAVIQKQELELFALRGKLTTLEIENASLKKNIEDMAMENSSLLPKKRKVSQAVIDRWNFYHANKDKVAAERNLTNWRDVKKVCDDLFASHK